MDFQMYEISVLVSLEAMQMVKKFINCEQYHKKHHNKIFIWTT